MTGTTVSSGLTVLRNDIAQSQSSDDDDSASDDDPGNTIEESKLPEKADEPSSAKLKSRDRPKKKQKLDHAVEGSQPSAIVIDEPSTPVSPSAQADIQEPSAVLPPTSSITPHDLVSGDHEQEPEQAAPLPTLPRFPLPRQPEAPSASVLYLQGVDEALIEAEIVDPAKTLPLSILADGDGEGERDESGLSLKTRQRLVQLGILELFAGTLAFSGFNPLQPSEPCSFLCRASDVVGELS